MKDHSYRTADNKAQIDWSLEKKKEGLVFSATGEYDGGSGQCIAHIAEAYPDDAIVQTLTRIWKAYHLNDMRAGTTKQRALGWGSGYDVALSVSDMTEPQKAALLKRNEQKVSKARAEARAKLVADLKRSNVKRRDALKALTGKDSLSMYDDENMRCALSSSDPRTFGFLRAREIENFREMLNAYLDAEAAKLVPVPPVVSEVFEDSIGAPCPETGFLYGHAWLFEPLPKEVLEQLEQLAPLVAEPLHEYKAAQFLRDHKLDLRVTLSDTKTPSCDVHGHHYRVTISRDEAPTRLVFDFFGSKADADEGKEPTAYDILACISSDLYTPETLQDFIAEFGGESDSIKTRQQFNRCDRFARRLREFFADEDQRQQLGEIR